MSKLGSTTNHCSYLLLNSSIVFAWCTIPYCFLPTDLGYSPLVEVTKSKKKKKLSRHLCCMAIMSVVFRQTDLPTLSPDPLHTYIQQLCMVEPSHARMLRARKFRAHGPRKGKVQSYSSCVFNFAYGASTPLYFMGKHGNLKLLPNLQVYNVHSHQHMPYSHTHPLQSVCRM